MDTHRLVLRKGWVPNKFIESSRKARNVREERDVEFSLTSDVANGRHAELNMLQEDLDLLLW